MKQKEANPAFRRKPGVARLARFTGIILLVFLAGCRSGPSPASMDETMAAWLRRGLAAYNEGRFPQAEKAWRKGLDAARHEGRTDREAEFLVRLSQAGEGMGRYDAALRQAAEALDILGKGGDPAMRCMALLQQGLAFRRTARYAVARPCFDRALEIARDLQDPHLESESLRNLAALHQDQGELDAALPLYREAIQLARAHGDAVSEGRSLNNLGLLFDARAEYAEALEHHRASLALKRKTGDRAGEGKVLGNLCITYSRLNQIDPALRHCKAALSIAREIGDRQREANHLNNIGALYRRFSQSPKALRYYQRSLKIKQQLNDPAGEARALNNIGEVYLELGRHDNAEENLKRSLEIKAAIGDLPGQSASYQNLALVHFRRGRYEEARSAYMKALFFNARAGRPELAWRAYDGLSHVYERLSNLEVAILYGKQALTSIQKTRGRMAALEKPLRLSYLTDKTRVYRHVADLLIQEGRLLEAQQVLSLLKEEEYWHFLDTRGPDAASVEDVVTTVTEGHWIERIAAFDGELGEVGVEMESLEIRRREQGLTEAEKQRLERLLQRADEIQERFEAYLEELGTTYENQVEFGKKDLDSLQTLQGDLGEFELRTIIATFLVLKDNVSVILTTPSIQIPFRIPVPEADLNRRVFDFRQTLTRRDRDPRPQARELYDLLISPMEADLATLDVDTLMISLDGTLRYLPFAALFDGKRYLTERYNLALFTPAAKRLFVAKKLRDPRIAGLGTSEAIAGFGELPAVVEELDGIVREEDGNDLKGVLPGRVLLNRAFTAGALEDVLWQEYTLVHLATHFSFRPGTTKDSFLLLGDGERLTLSELNSKRYPFKSIDLLTLSACDTAVGAADAQGREIESFAALALNHGAGAVLATLWPVADVSTGAFMQLFYQLRNEHELSKAEALREVQNRFLTGTLETDDPDREHRGVLAVVDDEGGFTPPPHAPFSHPFYWAPFILMGNFL